MKKITAIFLLVYIITFLGFAKGPQVVVTVSNPLKLDRTSETIVLKWKDIQSLMPKLEPGKVQLRNEKTNKELISQSIDIDQNGKVDEIIFQSDFKAKESKEFIIESATSDQSPGQSLTDARFVKPREDVAWENDRIAFRLYGPPLAKEVDNGFDIWTKRVRYLIAEKWYKGDEDTGSARRSYHVDHGEGADYFNVGRSLGDGSCALFKNDTLFQPGVFASYKIISTGPIRTIFELNYNSVKFDGKMISEVKRISLDAGSNLNKVEVIYSCESAKESVPFAAGLVKRQGVVSYTDKDNRWVSLWGLTTEKEEQGSLGMGIVMTKEVFKGIKEDKVHLMTVGNVKLGKTATYYAGAGWTLMGDFKSAEDWNAYLKEFSKRISSPLKVKIEKQK